MKLSGSSREQQTLVFVGGLAVLILWLYASYIVRPLMREAANLGRQAQAARERLKTLQATTANEAILREQHRQVAQTVDSLRRLLPAEAELPAVIAKLSDLASQSQVKIQTIFPKPAIDYTGGAEHVLPGSAVSKDILIQIEALAGYHQLGTFLSFIESGDKPMQVSSLRISEDPKGTKRHHIKLLIHSYFSTGEAASAGKSLSVP